MEFNDLSYKIIGCVYTVYNKLGPGLLESVYEKALLIELSNCGLTARSQQVIKIDYDGVPLDLDLRLDIIVEDAIVLELKSVEKLLPVHFKQLFTYLRLADKRLGLLINFNVDNITKDGIKRVVYKI